MFDTLDNAIGQQICAALASIACTASTVVLALTLLAAQGPVA